MNKEDNTIRKDLINDCLRKRRAFSINVNWDGDDVSVAFIPVAKQVNVLGIAPVDIVGYMAIVRYVEQHGEWSDDALIERAMRGGRDTEIPHLLAANAVDLASPSFIDKCAGVRTVLAEQQETESMVLMGYRDEKDLRATLDEIADFTLILKANNQRLICTEILTSSEF